jgi:hypothetical protein
VAVADPWDLQALAGTGGGDGVNGIDSGAAWIEHIERMNREQRPLPAPDAVAREPR